MQTIVNIRPLNHVENKSQLLYHMKYIQIIYFIKIYVHTLKKKFC